MPSLSKVCFFFERRDFNLSSRSGLKKFIESLFKKEGRKLSAVNYIFCSDKRLLEINKQFLNHDYYTDIITFDLSESDSVQAEIYISIDRVRDNSKTLGISFKSELHRVVFHGALHLCGYGDKTKKQEEEMRAKENFHLNKYFSAKS
jgi:probable rRNA maturation factor